MPNNATIISILCFCSTMHRFRVMFCCRVATSFKFLASQTAIVSTPLPKAQFSIVISFSIRLSEMSILWGYDQLSILNSERLYSRSAEVPQTSIWDTSFFLSFSEICNYLAEFFNQIERVRSIAWESHLGFAVGKVVRTQFHATARNKKQNQNVCSFC